MFYRDKAIQQHLLKTPIHHEIVMAHSLELLPTGRNPVERALREKLSSTIAYNLNFLERFYPHGLSLVPDFLAESVDANLRSLFPAMTLDDCAKVVNWNMDAFLNSKAYETGQSALTELVLQSSELGAANSP